MSRVLSGAAVLMLASGWARAEVADSAANGFTSKVIVTIGAPPAEVYGKLIHPGDWWDPAHTFSGDAHNLTLDEKPMGCFCEKLPGNGAVRHMEVVFVAPGKTLVLSGALGPLQSLGAAGSMSFQLSPVEAGTKLAMTYSVSGYSPAGMNTWAAPVDGVLTQQLTRLKNYVEHGDPAPKNDRPK